MVLYIFIYNNSWNGNKYKEITEWKWISNCFDVIAFLLLFCNSKRVHVHASGIFVVIDAKQPIQTQCTSNKISFFISGKMARKMCSTFGRFRQYCVLNLQIDAITRCIWFCFNSTISKRYSKCLLLCKLFPMNWLSKRTLASTISI